MRRPLRRLHFGLWLILSPIILAFIAYALTRAPIDKTAPNAPAILYETNAGR